MVKSTVRFSETVMDRVEELVSGEQFSSKSEFQRFAVEYVLSEVDDYEPEMLDFEAVRDEVFPDHAVGREEPEVTATASSIRPPPASGSLPSAVRSIPPAS